jgi:hypothetical protein
VGEFQFLRHRLLKDPTLLFNVVARAGSGTLLRGLASRGADAETSEYQEQDRAGQETSD